MCVGGSVDGVTGGVVTSEVRGAGGGDDEGRLLIGALIGVFDPYLRRILIYYIKI